MEGERPYFDEGERPYLCRFLDAGIRRGGARSGGVQKAPGHEVAGRFGRRAAAQRYGDLIVAPVMVVGAELASGDLGKVWRGAWKRAMGIAVVARSVSTGDRLVDWRGCAKRERRQRGAGATERESGGADRRSGS